MGGSVACMITLHKYILITGTNGSIAEKAELKYCIV